MNKKNINILITNLPYLTDNYGVQGIALPVIDALKKKLDVRFTFLVLPKYIKDDAEFALKNGFSLLAQPTSFSLISMARPKLRPIIDLLKLITRRKKNNQDLEFFSRELDKIDVVLDLSGIQYIGNVGTKRKWINFLNFYAIQLVAQKKEKLYLKYTKSYGPIVGPLYKYFVKKSLNSLPFVLVRGLENKKVLDELTLERPVYSFPDASILLGPASEEWARKKLGEKGLNLNKPIVGISPSSVIRSITSNSDNGSSHEDFILGAIKYFQKKGLQTVLLPHSIDLKNEKACDLSFSKKIMLKLDSKNVFLIDDRLTYKEARAIVGQFSFFVTSRYHGLASGLSMLIPVVSLSWHIKYKDMMSLFYEKYLAIDSRNPNLKAGLMELKKYYEDQSWFQKDRARKNKERLEEEINESIDLIINEIIERL